MTDHQYTARLETLQDWYAANCNGDWEHEFGVKIENIDNPGWSVSIPVSETTLAGRPFTPIQWQHSGDDWIACGIEDDVFRGSGGPRNLTDIVQIFLDWAAVGRAGL